MTTKVCVQLTYLRSFRRRKIAKVQPQRGSACVCPAAIFNLIGRIGRQPITLGSALVESNQRVLFPHSQVQFFSGTQASFGLLLRACSKSFGFRWARIQHFASIEPIPFEQ